MQLAREFCEGTGQTGLQSFPAATSHPWPRLVKSPDKDPGHSYQFFSNLDISFHSWHFVTNLDIWFPYRSKNWHFLTSLVPSKIHHYYPDQQFKCESFLCRFRAGRQSIFTLPSWSKLLHSQHKSLSTQGEQTLFGKPLVAIYGDRKPGVMFCFSIDAVKVGI